MLELVKMATLSAAHHFSAATKAAVPAKSSLLLPRLPVPASLRFCSFSFPVKLKPLSPKLFSIPLNAKQPQKYIYPDPDPEFALAETKKFRMELVKKLSMEKVTYGNELDAVVDVCAEIFYEFLRTEYGGPGTLLVGPFTNMMVALKEKKLPGAPLAARTSLLWAQNYLDQDWVDWKSDGS